MEINDKLKKMNIENCTCYYFGDINKFEEFDLDNILLNKKSFKNILVYNNHKKLLLVLNLYVLGSIK